MPRPASKQKIVCGCLLVACFICGFVFNKIGDLYFHGKDQGLHIIDVHVQEKKFCGLFDGPYVERAAATYNRDGYRSSFLILDSLFPVIYSLFLVSLSYSYRKRKWYFLVTGGIVLGALFDYGENFTFLYYLYHPSAQQAAIVAFCTTLKSLLLPVNVIVGIFLFIRSFF